MITRSDSNAIIAALLALAGAAALAREDGRRRPAGHPGESARARGLRAVLGAGEAAADEVPPEAYGRG
ncbi:hypothetical protein [Aquisphaera insulae]|uniref:hypothetical protein n=1 Tax=Aquisphaera insulae TaxID=2712864 RepID=UPI0013EBC9AF|nr:hypothetical protein [Aquisphaera insulae]